MKKEIEIRKENECELAVDEYNAEGIREYSEYLYKYGYDENEDELDGNQ